MPRYFKLAGKWVDPARLSLEMKAAGLAEAVLGTDGDELFFHTPEMVRRALTASEATVLAAHDAGPSVPVDPEAELDAALAALPATASVQDLIAVLRGKAGRKGRAAARGV